MFDDPIIKEVREIRRKIEAECHNDLNAYYEHLLTFQQKYRDRLVRRAPKLIRKQEEINVL